LANLDKSQSAAAAVVSEFYRCPEDILPPGGGHPTSGSIGYFRFGGQTICFGRTEIGAKGQIDGDLPDAAPHVRISGATLKLPFNPAEVLENLRLERYAAHGYNGRRSFLASTSARNAYYRVRPVLPVSLRKHAQQFFHRNWRTLPFPAWPVDTTVEDIQERLLVLSMKAANIEAIPFIWFWPEGASACAMLTHDVETAAGAAFIPSLMDLDDSFGFKASFQIIPEKQYPVSPSLLESIRTRGFEVSVQDLRHEGNLFDDHQRFLHRAKLINRYVADYRAAGFRAGRMFRNPDWLGALEIEYDMSIPNVAHLDPQRGGCCTVFPYLIGNILELPLTTTQDYMLFHILGSYSIDLWKEQISLITQRHGLVSFIVHPDYILQERERNVYQQLLGYLADLRDKQNVWAALPAEVNRWWRARAEMTLIRDNGQWTIKGPGHERARIAWARVSGDHIVYSLGAPENEPKAFNEVNSLRPSSCRQ
jgi:hypothetical protein